MQYSELCCKQIKNESVTAVHIEFLTRRDHNTLDNWKLKQCWQLFDTAPHESF